MKSVYISTFFYKVGKSENLKVSVLKFTLQPFMEECPVAVILSSILYQLSWGSVHSLALCGRKLQYPNKNISSLFSLI